jgi:hypothetical protein
MIAAIGAMRGFATIGQGGPWELRGKGLVHRGGQQWSRLPTNGHEVGVCHVRAESGGEGTEGREEREEQEELGARRK